MKQTSKQWSSVNIYENFFPNEREMAVFKKVNTEKIIWESIQFTKLWLRQWDKENLQLPKLVSYLGRNDSTKWNDVFVWCAGGWYKMAHISKKTPFLKEMMLAIAENVAVTFTEPRYGGYPLMLAAEIDDTDSILALIKRGADVNRQDDFRRTALHYAAWSGNINACEILLDNDAYIDTANTMGETPLMYAAKFKEKNMFEYLIKKGANKTLINDNGKTASELASFYKR